jgi:hypothetical protein
MPKAGKSKEIELFATTYRALTKLAELQEEPITKTGPRYKALMEAAEALSYNIFLPPLTCSRQYLEELLLKGTVDQPPKTKINYRNIAKLFHQTIQDALNKQQPGFVQASPITSPPLVASPEPGQASGFEVVDASRNHLPGAEEAVSAYLAQTSSDLPLTMVTVRAASSLAATAAATVSTVFGYFAKGGSGTTPR